MAWQRCALQIGYVMHASILDTLPHRSSQLDREVLTGASAHVRLIPFWRVTTHSRSRMHALKSMDAWGVPDELIVR